MTDATAQQANTQNSTANETKLRQALSQLLYLDEAESSEALLQLWVVPSTCRVNEAQNAKLNEIDLVSMTWAIPAERRKDRRKYIIPITGPMAKLLEKAIEHEPGLPKTHDDRLFEMRSPVRLQALKGIRSLFRQWATAQAKSSHKQGDQQNVVEPAYSLGSDLQSRRQMMEAWAENLMGASNV